MINIRVVRIKGYCLLEVFYTLFQHCGLEVHASSFDQAVNFKLKTQTHYPRVGCMIKTERIMSATPRKRNQKMHANLTLVHEKMCNKYSTLGSILGAWGWGQQVMRNSPLFQKILGCIINIFRGQAFCNHKIWDTPTLNNPSAFCLLKYRYYTATVLHFVKLFFHTFLLTISVLPTEHLLFTESTCMN